MMPPVRAGIPLRSQTPPVVRSAPLGCSARPSPPLLRPSFYSSSHGTRKVLPAPRSVELNSAGPELLPEYLPAEMRGVASATASTAGPLTAKGPTLPLDKGLDEAVIDFEKAIIQQALAHTKDNVLQTATLLRIPRGTLRYKMDKYGL